MDKSLYFHPLYETKEKELKDILQCEDTLQVCYQEFDEKLKVPDLLGKTVLVTSKQFNDVYKCACDLSRMANIEIPKVYIYEDFYYGMEAKGSVNPWIEVSAKTIADFSMKDIRFLLAREICRIKHKAVYLSIITEQTQKILGGTNLFPGMETLEKGLKVKYSQWSRVSNYTADCYGYLMTKDLQSCIKCILALILNNLKLVENVNIQEYLAQAEKIYLLDDVVSRYTKNDEKVPYGPFRLKNLLAYATKRNVIEFCKEEV